MAVITMAQSAQQQQQSPLPAEGSAAEVAADVLHQALVLVAYPTHPIWDPHTLELTPEFERAAQRIFRILDQDRDGLLSADEFGQYQSSAFEMRLTEEEITTFFAVRVGEARGWPTPRGHPCCPRSQIHADEWPEGMAVIGESDLRMNEEGFIQMLKNYIMKVNTCLMRHTLEKTATLPSHHCLLRGWPTTCGRHSTLSRIDGGTAVRLKRMVSPRLMRVRVALASAHSGHTRSTDLSLMRHP